jgi:hypothetical protein
MHFVQFPIVSWSCQNIRDLYLCMNVFVTTLICYGLPVQRSDVKELKVFYKTFIEKLRPEQNGNIWRR